MDIPRLIMFLFEVLSFVAVIVLIPLFLPISFICYMYRMFNMKLVMRKTRGIVTMVQGNDSVWLQDSRENTAVINTLIKLKDRLDIHQLRKNISKRILKATDDNGDVLFPKLTRYVTQILHRYVWVPEEQFNVEDHIIVWDQIIPDVRQELEKVVSELTSMPLPSEMSRWQFVLIPTKSTDASGVDSCYLLARVHHSIADGISLMKMVMQHMFSHDGLEVTIRRFGSRSSFKRICQLIFEGPALLLSRLFLRSDKNMLHGPKLSGQKVVAWSDPIDLAVIKKIKNAVPDTTVNDILMSAMGGAFREYFQQQGTDIPDSIKAYVPVDVRSPNANIVLDNQFALVFFHLPVIHEDPLRRLVATKNRMDEMKSSPEALLSALFIRYCMNRLPNCLTQLFFDLMSHKCSMVLSNVPGPQSPVSLCGVHVEDMIFWPPQRSNIGLGVSILTYNNTVKLGVLADVNLMKEPGVLVDLFVEHIHHLSSRVNVDDCQSD